MNFTKQHLCELPYCYAVSPLTIDGRLNYILATDDEGPCYCIDAETGECETVWDGPGGTMSIIPLPGTNGEFLASQLFLPNFTSLHARIMRVRRLDGVWQVEPWLELPYVHRFDLLERGGRCYFIGCILSGTKEEQADWSNPGSLVTAELGEDFAPPQKLKTIAGGMSRNHGYWRAEREGYSEAYTACDEGVFRVTPPAAAGGEWSVQKILDAAVSDLALCDIDGDGVEELATIEPFHGNAFVIYKKTEKGYTECYRYPQKTAFLHAIWGGKLCGEPVFLAGYRELDKAFFLVRNTPLGLQAQVIERGYGPSNVAFIPGETADYILVANRQSAEGALFTVQKEVR